MATTETMSEPMETTTSREQSGNGSWIDSPVDDDTYNLLMALASKLEAIDTYRKYASNGDQGLWRELAGDDRRHAERLWDTLRKRIGSR